MTPLVRRITKLLDPLTEFYTAVGRTLPHVEQLTGGDLPSPYRELLDHANDMTSTLEAYWQDSLHLRVLNMHAADCTLSRQVVLETDSQNRPVEFGAIQIFLERFSTQAQSQILKCHRPLGTIIAIQGVEYRSQPTAFFEIESDEITRGAFSLESAMPLFGRHNVLSNGDGETLAEVVEILAPCDPA